MNKRVIAAAAGILLVVGAGGSTAMADSSAPVSAAHVLATAKPKKYKNCTALNKVYKHGVGKKGAKDKVSGTAKPVTNFTVSSATYKLNTKSDRDKDGIACEKH